ncbi:MAG TPA: helicase C-terminal domain-containing protein, partial [Burkholderiaceae bacterium]|nr:helicase C-terminal domain-containing protein [Burkholderiaceae bacterium]
ALATIKGRRRYLCPARVRLTKARLNLAREFDAGVWDGDLDDKGIAEEPDSDTFTSGARECAGEACPDYNRCPYRVATERAQKAAVVVTNHAYLISASRLGEDAGHPCSPKEGVVLIVDEAHCLEDTARQILRRSLPLGEKFIATIQGQWRVAHKAANGLRLGVPEHIVGRLSAELRALRQAANCRAEQGALVIPAGKPPAWLRPLVARLRGTCAELMSVLDERLLPAVRQNATIAARSALPVLSVVGRLADAIEQAESVLAAFEDERPAKEWPPARWLEGGGDEVAFAWSAPIEVGPLLRAMLWERVDAAALVSATLRSVGGFAPAAGALGMPDGSGALALRSPFALNRQAVVEIPAMRADPSDEEAFCAEVASLLPGALRARGVLVLFASRAQMQRVYELIQPEIKRQVLLQGACGSTRDMLRLHGEKVAAGGRSLIFGMASFYTGVDLPGSLCEQVMIVRVPFRPPGDPIEQARAAAYAANGRSYFREVVLPDAGRRLVQGVGRLIRRESDRGTITIFDSRLRNTTWGSQLVKLLQSAGYKTDG